MKTYYIFGCLIIALALFLFLNFRPEFSKDKDDTYNVSVDKDGEILITPTQDMLNRFDQLKTQFRKEMDDKITTLTTTLGKKYQPRGDYLENNTVVSIQSTIRDNRHLTNGVGRVNFGLGSGDIEQVPTLVKAANAASGWKLSKG